jgi:NADH-quinone oxidoreductase subunit N
MDVLPYILPEILLLVAAAALFVMGTSKRPAVRHATPVVAILSLLAACFAALISDTGGLVSAEKDSLSVTSFSVYIKAISCGVAALFVLLAWPTNRAGDANRSIHFGTETGEFFALLLLAVAGMCVTASANSLPTLFLGIELASIPTYVMVTMSRPQEQAQEAGIK